jgi:MFS family permease
MPLHAGLRASILGGASLARYCCAATMASSLGMAFGPCAGGWVFDTFNGQAWFWPSRQRHGP